MKECFTKSYKMDCAAAQGSILVPTLFSLYMLPLGHVLGTHSFMLLCLLPFRYKVKDGSRLFIAKAGQNWGLKAERERNTMLQKLVLRTCQPWRSLWFRSLFWAARYKQNKNCVLSPSEHNQSSSISLSSGHRNTDACFYHLQSGSLQCSALDPEGAHIVFSVKSAIN